jgi:hypothetical protein
MDEDHVGIFRRNQRKPRTDASLGERRAYVEPVMDRELPLAMFAAVVAAIVLVAIQVQSSSAAQKKEAAARAHTAYSAVQHRPDSRLASSQLNSADTLAQRVH